MWAVLAAGVVWVGLWGFGVKGFDSALLGLFAFILPAIAWVMIKPWFERTILRRG